jgi:hypothetical protein
MICREPIENGHVHLLIVPAQFGALVPRRDPPADASRIAPHTIEDDIGWVPVIKMVTDRGRTIRLTVVGRGLRVVDAMICATAINGNAA